MDGTYSTYGETRNAYNILVKKPKVRDRFGERDTDGRITLKCTLEKYGIRVFH
jgi:hypothetical protein